MNINLLTSRWYLPAVCVVALVSANATAHTDPAVASIELSEQLAADGASATVLLQRAEAYRQSRNWAAALADYQAAEDLGMGVKIASYRARMYLDAGEWTKCIAESKHFLNHYPDNAIAKTTLAYAEYGAGSTDAAIANMEQALANHPALTPDEFLDLSLWYQQSGDFAAAINTLETGLQRLGYPVSLAIRRIELEGAAKRRIVNCERCAVP